MKQRLTAKEEALMNIFWEKGDLCIRELVENLPDPKPNYKTVATQVGCGATLLVTVVVG